MAAAKRRQQPRRARALTIEIVDGRVVLTAAAAPAQSSLIAVMTATEARRLARSLVQHAKKGAV